MPYSDFQATKEYVGAGAGAQFLIVMTNNDNPSEVFTGFSGVSGNDDFEQVPIEEAGNDGVDEFATGRHSGAVNLNGFWRAEYNDNFFPTRQSFIGKTWTLMRKIAPDRPSAGTVVDVWTNVNISSYSSQQGARGAVTFAMSAPFSRRYNGEEWATIAAG